MLKTSMMLASLGLVMYLFVSGVPGLVAAGGTSGRSPSLLDALTNLIGAEAEALQVAGAALQQPTPPDLATRANTAGARVEDAAYAYIKAAQALTGH